MKWFITFGGPTANYHNAVKRICNQASTLDVFDHIIGYTDKDLKDLNWAIEHPVSFIALSFVRQASDVRQLRQELDSRGIDSRIIAKIEKPAALVNLDSILEEVDALMVARGDLGVELDVAQVPAAQKRIIAKAARAGLPVITASMGARGA